MKIECKNFTKCYNLRAFEYKDELFIFWGQKVIGQGRDETKYG